MDEDPQIINPTDATQAIQETPIEAAVEEPILQADVLVRRHVVGTYSHASACLFSTRIELQTKKDLIVLAFSDIQKAKKVGGGVVMQLTVNSGLYRLQFTSISDTVKQGSFSPFKNPFGYASPTLNEDAKNTASLWVSTMQQHGVSFS